MSEPVAVAFYYGIGSRYSYLASTRLQAIEERAGCRFVWRPLYSGDLFALRGADPFAGPPRSGQYDWAYRKVDAEAWAAFYGVPFRDPADLAFEPRRLALSCVAAGRMGGVERFSRRLFEALFVHGRTPLDDTACAALAEDVGLDPAVLLTLIDDPGTHARHRATLAEAHAAGVFGVPSFGLGERVFFGNDRLVLLEHALARRA